MKFGNIKLSGWLYVYTSAVEGELGDISWFLFEVSDLPPNHTIVDAIAASFVTIYPVTIKGKIESWFVSWKDEKIAKLYYEFERPPVPDGYYSDVENTKKEIDNFLLRMSNLIIFA